MKNKCPRRIETTKLSNYQQLQFITRHSFIRHYSRARKFGTANGFLAVPNFRYELLIVELIETIAVAVVVQWYSLLPPTNAALSSSSNRGWSTIALAPVKPPQCKNSPNIKNNTTNSNHTNKQSRPNIIIERKNTQLKQFPTEKCRKISVYVPFASFG